MGPTCRYLISYSADQMYPFVRSRAGQAGFDDFRGLRSDKDLAALRANAKFEALLGRFEPKGLLALLMGGNKKR